MLRIHTKGIHDVEQTVNGVTKNNEFTCDMMSNKEVPTFMVI
jgi:hypothetical protein